MSVWEGETQKSAFSLLTKRWVRQVKGQFLVSLDAFKKKWFFFKEKCPLSLFCLGSQLPVVLESTDWSVPWVELSRSYGVSGKGGGSAARTVWVQWLASPSRWALCFPNKVWSWFWPWSTLCHLLWWHLPLRAVGIGQITARSLQHTLWGLCSLPSGHGALASVCLMVAVLFPASGYEADLKFRGINHDFAPVQQFLMSQDQGWLLPTLAVISRSKSWPFSSRGNGRRIS